MTTAASGTMRLSIDGIDFLGTLDIPTTVLVGGTQVGGLSGLVWNAATGSYLAISDSRTDARFYSLSIDLADGSLDAGDATVTSVTTLTNAGVDFDALLPDPEGIAFGVNGEVYVSSERDIFGNPAIYRFGQDGTLKGAFAVDAKFQQNPSGTNGVRSNLAFESLTTSPDGKFLYTATESALRQDGGVATLTAGSAARIVKYDLATGLPVAEYVYEVDPIADAPTPGAFADSGLVELIALDNLGTFIAMERSFSTGGADRGYTIKLYLVSTAGATNVIGVDSLPTSLDEDGELEINVDAVATKTLLLDLGDLGIVLDNIEGMTLGPVLADGRQSLILISDDNFGGFGPQSTQVVAFALDLTETPTITPVVETPTELRYDNPLDLTEGSDPDDPALWVNPNDKADSVVITAMKEGGLRVYNLAGEELQRIEPEGIRYNNVDVIYGAEFGGRVMDIAIASDRANDSLAIFRIRKDGSLVDITSGKIPASIFGVDDGEATAYGMTAYTSLVDGETYVFVTQASGASIAQLRLIERGGKVGYELVRTLDLPVAEGDDPEDYQSEGITIDRETGIGYVTVEDKLGLLSFEAELGGSDDFTVVAGFDTPNLTPDLEGVAIYYGKDGEGLIIVSSQGDNSFAVFDRVSKAYLGSFAIRGEGGIDGVEECDSLEIFSGSLPGFEGGLLMTQDGSNELQVVFADPEDGEIQNYGVNFKFSQLSDVLDLFGRAGNPDFDPRVIEAQTLANGVSSGDVTEDSVVLWARSLAPGRLTFRVFEKNENGNRVLVAQERVLVTDTDQPVKVEIDGLDDGTRYVYTVRDAAGDAARGRFETANEAGEHHGLHFGVTGDWRGDLAPYVAVKNAIDAKLDFFVFEGDTIYGDYVSPAIGTVTDLDGYRVKYQEVYGSREGANFLADLRASTSIFASLDDHEVINDFSGGADIASDPRFTGTGLINDSAMYEDGIRAFQDYHALREEVWSGTGDARTEGELKLYRAQSFGDDASIFLLDNRSFRDTALADPTGGTPAELAAFLAASLTEDRTMLGEAQLEALKADLLASEAAGVTWKFVMTAEPIQNLGAIVPSDRFEGYAKERTELLSFIEDNGIANVVFVAADVHATLVNNLTYQEVPGGAQIATGAFEITTGAVGFEPGFGASVIAGAAAAGLLTPAQLAFYNSLPVAPDTDSLANDRDDFFASLVNSAALDPLGLDPLGLDDNLAIADGRIDAELLAGDYVAAHSYSWTEFDINKRTQVLTVTTWGVPIYAQDDIEADPEAILALEPEIISQFTVRPQELGDDFLF